MTEAPEPSGGDQHKGAKPINSVVVEAHLLRHECELVRTAYAILLRRRRRHDQFNVAMFGEPAWDMLLEILCTGDLGLFVYRRAVAAGVGNCIFDRRTVVSTFAPADSADAAVRSMSFKS